ncbi:MAG TPA: endonuclease/exonuclease/phosphatase family protein [Armatimonadota bacterium]|jgi:endonuclease/exonuclease/phosphatase (EEP) superfamily protein YafD
MNMQPTDSPQPAARPDPVRLGLAALSALLGVAIAAAYALRPVRLDSVTVFPLLVWAGVGVFVVLVALSRRTRQASLLALLIWTVVVGGLAEEPVSLLRGALWRLSGGYQTTRPAEVLRVISLNCAGGQVAAAQEVLPYDPDVVLFQETPGRQELEQAFPAASGWQVNVGLDAAIAVRGTLAAQPLERADRMFLTVARAIPRRAPSVDLTVVSTHFAPRALSFQLWRPSVWIGDEQLVRHQASQMVEVRRYAESALARGPVIVGGDFNSPGGAALFRPLRPHFRDCWAVAGQGWPDTITNDSPFSRIDQVWVSPEWEVVRQWVERTANSDHRMVICDLRLRTVRQGQPTLGP